MMIFIYIYIYIYIRAVDYSQPASVSFIVRPTENMQNSSSEAIKSEFRGTTNILEAPSNGAARYIVHSIAR